MTEDEMAESHHLLDGYGFEQTLGFGDGQRSWLGTVHWVGDAIQPSHLLSSPSPTFNLSQHQGLFQ